MNIRTVLRAKDLNIFAQAVSVAGLEDKLDSRGPWTVYAPTDKAFESLPPGTLEELMKDQPRLLEIVKYHLVDARFTARQALERKEARSYQGGFLNFDTCEGLKVNNALVLEADIEAHNGLVNIIDSVLMP